MRTPSSASPVPHRATVSEATPRRGKGAPRRAARSFVELLHLPVSVDAEPPASRSPRCPPRVRAPASGTTMQGLGWRIVPPDAALLRHCAVARITIARRKRAGRPGRAHRVNGSAHAAPFRRPCARARGGFTGSWKAISAYLKRDVSTVQRWEKRRGHAGAPAPARQARLGLRIPRRSSMPGGPVVRRILMRQKPPATRAAFGASAPSRAAPRSMVLGGSRAVPPCSSRVWWRPGSPAPAGGGDDNPLAEAAFSCR